MKKSVFVLPIVAAIAIVISTLTLAQLTALLVGFLPAAAVTLFAGGVLAPKTAEKTDYTHNQVIINDHNR